MAKITSRPPTALYAAGWDRIFGKKTVTRKAMDHMVESYAPPPVIEWSVKDLVPKSVRDYKPHLY